MWPSEVTCHAGETIYAGRVPHWDPPQPEPVPHPKDMENMPPLPEGAEFTSPYGRPFRDCSYCGSIHPEDLYNLLSRERSQATCPRCNLAEEPVSPPSREITKEELDAWSRWNRARFQPHTCGVKLGGADWKYGWPHKFYVEGIANPIAGRLVCSGRTYSREGNSWHEPHPASAHTHAKFYNVHLKDLSPEAFALLAPVIQQHAGIMFKLTTKEGQVKLSYAAPYAGYQAGPDRQVG